MRTRMAVFVSALDRALIRTLGSGRAVLVALALVGCTLPQRVPLPAPYPVTEGATPVPGEGVGVGFTLGRGLRGPELSGTGVYSLFLAGGVGDRVSGSVATFTGFEDNDASGTLLRLKVLAARPFGERSALGVHFATATNARRDGDAQDDRVRAFDFALPLEFVVAAEGTNRLSLYGGPRFVRENYRDRLHRDEGARVSMPGFLGGLHANAGGLHVFVEGTVARVPESEYLGTTYGDRVLLMPAFELAFHVGRPFRW